MLLILSPAKKLDFSKQTITEKYTVPEYLTDSEKLMKKLKKLSKKDIAKLMNLSDKLAQTNYERYLTWDSDFNTENAKQAILAFNGDVYTGLNAKSLSEKELLFAQDHLRILSGLHGILKPLDLIKPYRLEMGTNLSGRGYKNLSDFWGKTITQHVNNILIKEQVLINLASNEYFKPIDTKKLNGEIITPIFKDYKNGTYKSLFLYVKQARGYMARYILQNNIKDPEELKNFEDQGYFYNENMSSPTEFVFTRG